MSSRLTPCVPRLSRWRSVFGDFGVYTPFARLLPVLLLFKDGAVACRPGLRHSQLSCRFFSYVCYFFTGEPKGCHLETRGAECSGRIFELGTV